MGILPHGSKQKINEKEPEKKANEHRKSKRELSICWDDRARQSESQKCSKFNSPRPGRSLFPWADRDPRLIQIKLLSSVVTLTSKTNPMFLGVWPQYANVT